jgi:photosystem II stability/assembly factor-like uncharacterized protein
MKILLQTLVLFLLVTQICFGQWFWQNPSPQGNDLNDVDFIDEFNGVAVGEMGTIIRTTDGGISWTIQESGTTMSFNYVDFIDINNGWIIADSVSYPTRILRTTNGGLNWMQQLSYPGLNGIWFLDANNGWVVGGWMVGGPGDTSFVLHTTNGGINWIHQPCGNMGPLYNLFFNDANNGWVVGEYGEVFKTTDGGVNWIHQTSNTESLYDVHFMDANTGWAVGGHNGPQPNVKVDQTNGAYLQSTSIIHTVDGGTTWTAQMDTLDALLYGVSFLDNNFGFAVGRTPAYLYCSGSYSGIILRTKDGGASCTIIDAGITSGWKSGFKEFCFTDDGDGIIVGNYGVILKSSNDGTIWHSQLNGTTKDLISIAFTDANNGFVVGNSGTIMRTIDSGADWITQPSGTTINLTDICFADEYNGWIVGFSQYNGSWTSIILHTTDGGINWLQQTSFAGSIQLYDLCFVDANNGWAAGAEYSGDGDGVILRTTDGGINWLTSMVQPSIGHFFSVYFIDSNTGWACGDGDIILKTTNGGTSWTTHVPSPGAYYSCVYFVDENNGWAVGDRVIHTTNGGANWSTRINYNYGTYYFKTDFVDLNNGWIVGRTSFINQLILKTTNGGLSWSSQSTGTYHQLNSVNFRDNNVGWLVGENGTILHTTNGGVSFVEEEEIDEVPTEFLIFQNYPNPFNPSTRIQYQVASNSYVSLVVYDILGNEIETLVNEEKPIGTYEITWYAEGLPSGVYFYQLKAGSLIETKKMMLLK